MKVGVVGLGSIGMRHARNLIALGHEVVGYDSSRDRMLAFGGCCRSIDEILEQRAIVIAVPTALHRPCLSAALGARKHVFVEKPIGDGNAEVLRGLLDDAARMHLAVMTGYNLRIRSCVRRAKAWIESGHIGKLQGGAFFLAQRNTRPAYLRDGVVLNWSHEIDLALHLLGPAKVETASVVTEGGHEMIADIRLMHDNGASSMVYLDYVTEPELRQSMVVGTKGKIHLDILGPAAVLECGSRTLVVDEADTFNDNYVDEMRSFIGRIKTGWVNGNVSLPGATGRDGLAVLEICLEAKRLGYRGRPRGSFNQIARGG